MNSFAEDDKGGRFFRNLLPTLKPSKTPIGSNTLAKYPEKIGQFLKLPDCSRFTSHSFRHTGASILADEGASVMQLQQAGGWESASVAESYVQESNNSRLQIAKKIVSTMESNQVVMSSTTSTSLMTETQKPRSLSSFPGFSISNSSLTHVVINYGTHPTHIDE
jgi:hypothetical protein